LFEVRLKLTKDWATDVMGTAAAQQRWRVATLLVVVMVDLAAVALVVPLLPLRMRELGVPPELVGLIGSVYSASQVVGGVVLGALSDRISRRSILLLNFAAAATSYAMVGFGESAEVLLLSRVVVGLCKQTMTLATALLTDITSPEDRPLALGQLRTATTLAWTIGQVVGGHLAEHSQQLPAVVAVCQYVVAAVITWFFLDTQGVVKTANGNLSSNDQAAAVEFRVPRKPKRGRTHRHSRSPAPSAAVETPSLWVTAEKLMRAQSLRQLFMLMGLQRLVTRGLGAMGAFYELDRFGLSPAELGNLSAFKTALSLIAPLLVGVLLRGEKNSEPVVIHIAVWAIMLANTIEAWTGPEAFWAYVFVSIPIKSIAGTCWGVAIKSLFTKALTRHASEDVGAALGKFVLRFIFDRL
jgi:MFS family permease